MAGKSYSASFKFKVVREAISSDPSDAEIARLRDIHPNTLSKWKKELDEHGPEIFGGDEQVKEYENRIPELKQMLGKKEVEGGPSQKFFNRSNRDRLSTGEKVEMAEELCEEGHLLCDALEAVQLPSSTYYDHHKRDPEDTSNREDQKQVIRSIIKDHPGYGYRRIQPEYEARTGEVINHKALLNRLNEMDLALTREVNQRRRSGVQKVLDRHKGQLNLVAGWEPGPLECLSTDFTEIQYAAGLRKT